MMLALTLGVGSVAVAQDAPKKEKTKTEASCEKKDPKACDQKDKKACDKKDKKAVTKSDKKGSCCKSKQEKDKK